MLQFILGKSGTGKTARIYELIKSMADSGNDKMILLVPDQSTFETEKAILELMGARKSGKVMVTGFSGLCRHAFEKCAVVRQNVIDNGTRAVLMNLALEQLADSLTLLKTNRRNVAEVMLNTLTDCKNNNITPEKLRKTGEAIPGGTLKTKLSETALVLETFDALVKQSYIDPLDDLGKLYDILLENNDFLSGYTLFVDSFSGFTANQLMVFRLLMSRCAAVYFALTLDPNTTDADEVFSTSHSTMRSVKELAKRDFINIKAPVKLLEPLRFENSELAALEKNIFRADSAPCDDAPKNITLYAAADIYDECEFTARQIKRLVIENNSLYSDITVICHDTDLYEGTLDVVFEKYGIPFFMDSRRDITVKPVIRLVNSIFRLIIENFQRDDVMAFLKTGLTNNSEEEISCFENYVYIWNVDHSAFRSEFKNNPGGFSDTMTEKAKAELALAEKVRRSVIEPIISFKEKITEKDGEEITRLLYELLLELGVPDTLVSLCEKLEQKAQKGLGEEQLRIWSLLMDALDKTAAATRSVRLSVRRYFELLSIMTSQLDFAEIPQTLDSVTVTTAQRVRLSKQKTTFLIGCIDGVFPTVPHTSGVFSAFELRLLSMNDLKLSEDFSALSSLETFMAYCCMCSPSKRLFASSPAADIQGEKYLPSVIFHEIQRVFPKLKVLDSSDFDDRIESMLAIEPAFEEYARSLGNDSTELCGLKEFFDSDPYYSPRARAVRRALDNSAFLIENPVNAEELFGKNLRISASQLEKFNLCRFSYFCGYGLRVRERLKAEINQLEYGTLVHYILEQFFSSYTKNEYKDISNTEISAFAEKTLDEYLNTYFGGAEAKPKAFLYRLEVIKENVSILLRHIIDELSQSDFDVRDCELKIGADIPSYTITLPTGQKIAVVGSVDRVDIMEKDGESYIRIIDYKTGTKKFKLSDILFGLNMQMLLYLYSIQKNGSERYGSALPAGILYMPATVPVLSVKDDITTDGIKSELDSKLKMNGLLLDSAEVISGMDKSGDGRYIPVKIKAGAGASGKCLATLEEFGKIFKKLDLTVAQMGRELYGGRIEAAPAKGAHDACEYCPYDSVCGYRISGMKNTFEVDNAEVIRQINEELNKDGER